MAAGCPWRAGMLTVLGDRFDLDYRGRVRTEDAFGEWQAPAAGDLPDLREAATRGAVLEALREKVEDETLHVWWSHQCGHWVLSGSGRDIIEQATTEAEALVLAWEAA